MRILQFMLTFPYQIQISICESKIKNNYLGDFDSLAHLDSLAG
jgi:hypothetical protein